MAFKTVEQWYDYLDNGYAGDDAKLLTDILQAINSGTAATRPLLQEIIVDIANDKVTLADDLSGTQIALIVAEDGNGVAVEGNTLAGKISSIAGGTFHEKYFINKGIADSGTLLQSIASLTFPALDSVDIIINLNNGHGLSKLHFFVIGPVFIGDENDNILGDGDGGGIGL